LPPELALEDLVVAHVGHTSPRPVLLQQYETPVEHDELSFTVGSVANDGSLIARENRILGIERRGAVVRRKRGPWQGMHRGDLSKLNPKYWLDVEEQGYLLVR